MGNDVRILVGLDVGSTTVKGVAVDAATGTVWWRDYRRHEMRQLETSLEFLARLEELSPAPRDHMRVFVTGSGGATVAEHTGACLVQEVNAVTMAVEALHPDAGSIIELGGQDAKIIVFKTDPKTGRKLRLPSMNDKCAGGTGTVIDKIAAKLGIGRDRIASMRYDGIRTHPVAAKCGVFAETDVTGLLKQGIAAEELMASLFEAVVQQNLAVLARGHTLLPLVLLLGGPNHFIPGLRECWRAQLTKLWAERNVELPSGKSIEELVRSPENAHYFAAQGAIEFGKRALADDPEAGRYMGTAALRKYVDSGRFALCRTTGMPGPGANKAALDAFIDRYRQRPWTAPTQISGTVVEAFMGIDAGSTTTKAVLLDQDLRVIAKAYQLSQGNPIEDAQQVLASLRRQIEVQGCRLEILGLATTGYAKDILARALGADVALVETVAHTRSGLHYYPHADVICDVGGQDIKIILLKDGVVRDFRLNTQCSAGNGYYLQATVESFGCRVEEYAELAFSAEAMPEFGYGCAVFLQTDIVNYQRIGWRPNEILAGLAAVLPKNIWLYVCQMPNMSLLGKTFILQGGTQRNLAAVKAQVDYIQTRFAGTGISPRIETHRHCGEAGAIGCAIEVAGLWAERAFDTAFIGFAATQSLRHRAVRNEATRCPYCPNQCLRTSIEVSSGNGTVRRILVANCEKGAVEDLNQLRVLRHRLDEVKRANPSLVEAAARDAFMPARVHNVSDPTPRMTRLSSSRRHRRALMERRAGVRIGVPRVLNMYGVAPFVMGYFQSLGLDAEQIVWSDYTSERLYREGATRGSIDPCFPSKAAIPHIHDLLFHKHAEASLTHVFFPMVASLPTWLANVVASYSCPASVATPEATHAAFTKESDAFAEHRVVYKKTFLVLDQPERCARRMYEDWRDEIGVSERESLRAVEEGLESLSQYQATLRHSGKAILDALEREQRLGIVLLARPYHSDPGLHHGIAEELQKLGYPILPLEALPIDEDAQALDISKVWKNSFSEHSSRKIWGACFVARHPNLVAVELSSFKCGHDAPLYTVIQEILGHAESPYFSFKDIDENRPSGALAIRVATIAYFLKRRHEGLFGKKGTEGPTWQRAAHRMVVAEPTPNTVEEDGVGQVGFLTM